MKKVVDLKTEIRRQIWASGEAENLVSAHDHLFQEGLADISKWVSCEQEDNVDIVHFCKTHFKCGMTIVSKPKGIISRVFTVANEQYCDPVYYRQVDWPGPECAALNFIGVPVPVVASAKRLPLGFVEADASTDCTCGRARTGIWAIHHGNIYVWPWIQSNEFVVIEWSGVKEEWADGDLVNGAQDYKAALKLFVQFAHQRDYGNEQKTSEFKGLYDRALAELMWQCREETKRRAHIACPEERPRLLAEIVDDAVPTPAGPLLIAQIADCADNDSNAALVSRLVNDLGSSIVVSAGNNSRGALGDYAASIGSLYGTFVSAKKFYPAPGGRDWGEDGQSPYWDFFPWLQQRHYYDVRLADVHFFILSSDPREPDGVTPDSVQGQWLQNALANSDAGFKIVICHHAPYSSGITHGSNAWMQWPFEAWGATAVISGHDHDYERLLIGGIPYFVNGCGGQSIRGFGSILPQSMTHLSAFGAMRIQTTSLGGITFEFYQVNDVDAFDFYPIGNDGGTILQSIIVIGDFGGDTADEAAVRTMIDGLVANSGGIPAQAVVTVGDNFYGTTNLNFANVDQQLGKHYHDFMAPYLGTYGAGATDNAFFPAIGNHDFDLIEATTPTPSIESYTNYFDLPGNERYYDVCLGNIHLFFLDSDVNEPDGVTADSAQAQWLRAKLLLSTAPWKIVVLSDAPYSSTAPTPALIWTYGFWGASMVISGKPRNYERFNIQGVPFINNGLGGDGPIDLISSPASNSVVRYTDGFGAGKLTATPTSLKYQFIALGGAIIDSVELTK